MASEYRSGEVDMFCPHCNGTGYAPGWNAKRVGQTMKAERLERHLTQSTVGERLGLYRGKGLGYWEGGPAGWTPAKVAEYRAVLRQLGSGEGRRYQGRYRRQIGLEENQARIVAALEAQPEHVLAMADLVAVVREGKSTGYPETVAERAVFGLVADGRLVRVWRGHYTLATHLRGAAEEEDAGDGDETERAGGNVSPDLAGAGGSGAGVAVHDSTPEAPLGLRRPGESGGD